MIAFAHGAETTGKFVFAKGVLAALLLCLGTTASACSFSGTYKSAQDDIIRCDALLRGQQTSSACPIPENFRTDLSFDDALHERWYVRFWTGECRGFRMFEFCSESGPNWRDSITDTLAQLPVDIRQETLVEMWALGKSIGFEWAKRNNIRTIHSSDLERWVNMLNSADAPLIALTTICQEAKARL